MKGTGCRRWLSKSRVVRAGLVSLGIGCAVSGSAYGVFRAELPGPHDAIRTSVRHIPAASAAYDSELPVWQREQVSGLINPETLPAPSAQRVPAALATLNPGDRTTFDGLIQKAKSSTERAYLYKTLAAGEQLPAIEALDRSIRSLTPAGMIAALTPVAPSSPMNQVTDSPLKQLLPVTCAATEIQLMYAWADPAFAWWLHQNGGDQGQAVADAQAEILAREGSDIAENTPFWFSILGLSNRAQVDEYNALKAVNGIDYVMYNVGEGEAAAAYDAVVRALKAGALVPMDVGDTALRHAVTAIATRDGKVLIHDPGYGVTGWETKAQFVDGQMDYFQGPAGTPLGAGVGGWPNVFRIMIPDNVDAGDLTPTIIIAPSVPALYVWIGGAGLIALLGTGAYAGVAALRDRAVVNRCVTTPGG